MKQRPSNLPLPSSDGRTRGGSLATIKEREEIVRSADPNVSQSRKMAAAAQANQIAAKQHHASDYNLVKAGRPPKHHLPQHRSPVLRGGGKENLQLPPIDGARQRLSNNVSQSRQDPLPNLRNNGSAIMGIHNSSSARNLPSNYRSNSRNGNDSDIQQTGQNSVLATGAQRQFVVGASYNIDPHQPQLSSAQATDEDRYRPTPGHYQ